MKIFNSAYSGLGTALMLVGGVLSSASDNGQKDLPKEMKQPDMPINRMQTPNHFEVVQVVKAEQDTDKVEVNKEEQGIHLITKRHVEIIKKNPDSLFAYEVLKSPVILADALEDFARKNEDTMAAMAYGERTKKITKDDLKHSRERPSVKLYFGINQNPSRPFEKEDLELAKKNDQYSSAILRTHMNDEARKYILDNIESGMWPIFYGVQNPLLIDNEKTKGTLCDVLVKSPGSWASESVAMNPRLYISNKTIRDVFTNSQNSYAANGILRSKNLKTTPTLLIVANQNDTSKGHLTKATYYNQLYAYHNNMNFITNSDVEAAKEFYNTPFAKIVMSHPKVTPNRGQIDFALQDSEHANSAFAIGVFSNPNVKSSDHIDWVVNNKGNAQTQAAYEITRRLSAEGFDKKINDRLVRKIMMGELCDTRAAKGAAENYFFPPLNSDGYYNYHMTLRREIREIRFSQFAYAAAGSLGFVPGEEDKKEAKSEFAPPSYSFNMGRNINWGEFTEADYDSMIDNPTHSLSLGMAGSENLNRNEKLENLVQKLTKTSPSSQILFELLNNPKWVKGLNENQKENDLKFVLGNVNTKAARGYFENPLIMISSDTKKILRKNPNSEGAIGAGHNIYGYSIEKDDIDFALSADGQKTVLGSVLLSRRDFPAEELVDEARKTNSGYLRLAILFHPALEMTLPYTEHKLNR